MALILRIASADGKDVIEKEVSKLPAKIKVPPGAKVYVVDTDEDRVWSLAAFINKNTGTDNEQLPPYVEVEEVSDWATAGDWLASIGDPGRPWEAPGYYTPGSRDEDGGFLGGGSTPLIVGGLLIGGGGAAFALAGGGSSNNGGGTDNPLVTTPSALDLAEVSDTGDSDTDRVTSISQGLIIVGAGDPGDEIALVSGGATLATGVVADTGAFAIAVSLDEGVHDIFAVARNADGDISADSASITVEVDLTPAATPSALDLLSEDDSGPSDTDNITNVRPGLTISGMGPAGVSIALFDETGSVLGGGETGENGIFEIDLTLDDGTYNIFARSVDLAGNISASSDPLNVVSDTVAPDAPSMPDLAAEADDGASDSDDVTSQTTGLTISGTTEPNAIVSLFNGGELLRLLTADADGNYSTDFDFEVDNYVIRAQVADLAGNISEQSLPLELAVVDIV